MFPYFRLIENISICEIILMFFHPDSEFGVPNPELIHAGIDPEAERKAGTGPVLPAARSCLTESSHSQSPTGASTKQQSAAQAEPDNTRFH
jgi:hypothetical protein